MIKEVEIDENDSIWNDKYYDGPGFYILKGVDNGEEVSQLMLCIKNPDKTNFLSYIGVASDYEESVRDVFENDEVGDELVRVTGTTKIENDNIDPYEWVHQDYMLKVIKSIVNSK